ncbi:MAG: hypothetical protein ACFFDT_06835 [Candidatus Hodarchaeota archaeon]
MNEEFVVRANVPDSIFKGRANRSLGAVDIHWNMDVWSEEENQNPTFMGAPILSAHLNLMFYAVHPSEIWDWGGDDIEYEEGWQWEMHSWQQNNTMGEGFEGSVSTKKADDYEYEPLPTRLKKASEEPEAAQEYEEPEPFFNIDFDQCEAIYDDITETWEIRWVGSFNERVYIGTYRVNMGIYSNEGERINLWGFNAWNWESNNNPEKWIGVGELAEYDIWWGYSQWGIKTLDILGKERSSVGVKEPFTFRFNISKGITPGFAYVRMSLPGGYAKTTRTTGWYQEEVGQMGGWVYNSTTGAYNYNSKINFSTTQNAYGLHEKEDWVSTWGQNYEIVNRSGWDWSSGEPVWVDWGEQWVSKDLFLIYNQTTSEFSIKIGYQLWLEDPDDPYAGGTNTFVLKDVNASNEIENIFKLTSWSKYQDPGERHIIEFTGYFRDFIGTSENQLWYDSGLFDVNGNQHWSDRAWGHIGINQPEAHSWIVDISGEKWDKHFFNMKPGEEFIIRNELIGSNVFWNSIDGVGFRLNCWDSQWTPELDIWSEIEIYVTYNLNSKATTFEAYNRTTKRIWENSTYEDWVETEKEGWHWEYDETLGYDVWVNGTYESWDWVEITDWHWQEYQFNQETQEWVRGWLPWRGRETQISSAAFVVINDASKYTNSEGFFLDLHITVMEGAPEAAYDWEVDFLKEKWGYDYTKPWGEYESLQWIEKNVYYYEDGEKKTYIEDPEIKNYAVINSTKYLIREMPYVEIAGEIRPLKVGHHLDWSNQLHEFIMSYDWDWRTNQEYFYYRDANTNERIVFYEGEKVNIYNVTINDDGATDTFQTMMNKPSQYWNEAANEEVFYFVDLTGVLHYLSVYTEWNETGGDLMRDYWNPDNTWSAENPEVRTINNINQVVISGEAREWDNRVFFVILDGTTRLELSSRGIQYYNGEQYITTPAGAMYTITTGEWNDQYGTDHTVVIDGIEYYISDHMEAYRVTYGGSEMLIPLRYNGYHNNWNDYLTRYYYTIQNGIEYPLPYPGAVVNDRWEMEGTVNGLSRGDHKQYGAVPVVYFIDIDGKLYQMENITLDSNNNPTQGDFVIGSVPYKNQPIFEDLGTIVNGSVNFDITIVGESIPYGIRRRWLPFEKNGTIEVLPGQKLVTHRNELQHYGSDNFYANNGSFYLNLTDNTRINARVNYTIPIFNVTVKTHNHITGQQQIWNGMKDILTVHPWDYWSDSRKFLPLLDGSLLEIPEQAWVEMVDEYYAVLEFNGTKDYGSYNWTEPDFNDPKLRNSINFTYNGTTYFYDNLTFAFPGGEVVNFLHYYIRVLEAEVNPGEWWMLEDPRYDETKEAQGWPDLYNITVGGKIYLVRMNESFIQLYQTIWGHPYGLILERQEVLTVKTTHNLIFGTPKNGMWGFRLFTTTEEGALDLDGDLATTEDQYYVYRMYESQDTFTHTRNVLEMEIEYDPITSVSGNELRMRSTMGINTMIWTYEWEEKFTWLKADGTFSPVSSTEMEEIVDTVLDENNFTRPGYWEIDRMVRNRTWADVVAEAEKYKWDWVLDNTHEWTWIEFNLDQNYWADFYADASQEDIKSALITNRYEYAGLMLYKDDDLDGFMDIGSNSEVTHFFVPSDVESVSFYTPDVSNAADHYQEVREYWRHDGPYALTVDVYTFVGAADIDWGVKFTNVNGTTYPFDTNNYRSMWDWYDGVIDGSDFRGFADKPVKVTIDELEFMVHFTGDTTTDGLFYNTDVKIDQWIGDWTPHISGGRDNLENYSLSLTYYVLSGRATGETSIAEEPEQNGGETQVIDENNQPINNDNQTISESYSMVVDDASNVFAKAELGSPYTWSFDTTKVLKVAVFTTPISTFSGAFMSDSGQSASSFNFEAELYFMSVGFPEWDGYDVYNDPTFQAYVGASSHGEGAAAGFTVLMIGGIGGGIAISVVLLRFRKKKRQAFGLKDLGDSSIPTDSLRPSTAEDTGEFTTPRDKGEFSVPKREGESCDDPNSYDYK